MPVPAALHWRGNWAAWAIIYAASILYASTIITPLGLHFVPIDPAVAWQQLLASRYAVVGDDQRPDWMANLLMLVPLGVLTTGALGPARRPAALLLAAALALPVCIGFVLAVKYAQLFFPPRTVTLNYILAQSLGALIGVVFFLVMQRNLLALAGGGRRALLAALWLYTLALIGFVLFHFDVTLDASTLAQRAWAMLWAWPTGAGLAKTLGLAAAQFAALLPVGALLALRRPAAGTAGAVAPGLAGLAVVDGVRLVLGGMPNSLPLQVAGMVCGVVGVRWLARQDMQRLRRRLRGFVWPAAIFYVLAVLEVKELLHGPWQRFDVAWATLDPRMLLPFFQSYIVSKAHAMAAAALHVVMFAPIGMMLWLRVGSRPWGPPTAAGLAAVFAIGLELGRMLKPGFAPDFANAVFAAASAWGVAKVCGSLWPTPPGATPGRFSGGWR